MAAIFVVVIGLYICNFHFGLSNSHSKWSEFGDYFNGLLSPILTAINIYVFIRLTRVIDENDDLRQSKAEAHEKAMLLMQYRKAELDIFTSTIQNAVVIKKDADVLSSSYPIMVALTYLECFAKTKLQLFSLEENSQTAKQILSLHGEIKKLNFNFITNIRIDNSLLLNIMNLRKGIINSLQEITIESK